MSLLQTLSEKVSSLLNRMIPHEQILYTNTEKEKVYF